MHVHHACAVRNVRRAKHSADVALDLGSRMRMWDGDVGWGSGIRVWDRDGDLGYGSGIRVWDRDGCRDLCVGHGSGMQTWDRDLGYGSRISTAPEGGYA